MNTQLKGILYLVIVILGLVMGSFLYCLSLRMLKKERVIFGRSRCRVCGHVLGVRDLIPVASWLLLRGKCRYCGQSISVGYPLSETLTSIVFLSVIVKNGRDFESLEILLLSGIALCIVFCDCEAMVIPDRLIIAGIILRFGWLLWEKSPICSMAESLCDGFLIAFPVLLIVLFLDRALSRPSMGGGDIKLIFMLGLYFSLPKNFIGLMIACMAGLVTAFLITGKKTRVFPFAPALCFGWWMVFLFGDKILSHYMQLMI